MSKAEERNAAAGGEGSSRNARKELLNKVLLDPDQLGDRESMACVMKQALDLPEWFGKNLDALADALSEVTDETVFEVEVEARDAFAKEDYPRKVLKVIARATKENPHLHLYLTDPLWRPGEPVHAAAETSRNQGAGKAEDGSGESESDLTWKEECCDWSDEL